MRFSWCSVLVLGVVVIAIPEQGCGGSSNPAPPAVCGNSNTCASGDPACTRGCGRGQSMLCECGTGALAGTLVCGPCNPNDAGTAASGGQNGRGTGGTAGRGGRGTGGAAGRAGRGTGGIQGIGGRAARGTGGLTGTGGAPPSDGAIADCPANAQAGGVTCMANITAICQTACVASMYNICSCSGGQWICPATQIPCP